MRFGMGECFLPDDLDELTPAICLRVRALGFSGIFTRFRKNDPLESPRFKAEQVRTMLAAHGLRMFQATGYWQNLITPDETQRRESGRVVGAALRLAAWLDASRRTLVPASREPDCGIPATVAALSISARCSVGWKRYSLSSR